jgi:hypothetical protein
MSERTPLVSIYSGRDCLGFVLARGPDGLEAFDRDEHSLGTFPSTKAAADAITARAAS